MFWIRQYNFKLDKYTHSELDSVSDDQLILYILKLDNVDEDWLILHILK